MGKRKIPKIQPQEQTRGRKRERTPDYSDDEEQLSLRDIERCLRKCDTWADVLRVDALFEDGIYEGHLPWLKELWQTRPSRSNRGGEAKENKSKKK